MQRHRSLYPLSHEHHHGLVQARQLRLASVQTGPASPAVAAEQFIEFWERELQRHFRQEEERVLPLIEKYAAGSYDKVGETLRQHAEIKQLVAALNAELAQGAGIDPGLLGQLGNALREHIRFEESVLFPLLEESVPETVLWQMNEQLTGGGA